MNIALFGGSFDPPHLGHIAVIHTAIKELDIDKLIVVPAFVNPFKTGTHAPAKLRLTWLEAIFKDDDNVVVSDFEVKQNRAVKSIETVLHYKKSYEKIYFIIGADNLASLKQWHQFKALDNLVTWVVATRDQTPIESDYKQLNVTYKVSSTELRENALQEHLPEAVAQEIKTYYEETHARQNQQDR